MLSLATMIFAQGCASSSDSFCVAARQIVLSEKAIGALERSDLLQIVNHNAVGEIKCHWKTL